MGRKGETCSFGELLSGLVSALAGERQAGTFPF